MASNRRKHFRQTRRSRMRELKPSPLGILAMAMSMGAAALFVAAVILSYRMRGEGNFILGSLGLLGFGMGMASWMLGILSLKEPKIRPLPPKTAIVLGVGMSVLLCGLYVTGCIF